MLETLLQYDTALFLFLNKLHNSLFDEVMYWASHKFFWVPLYMYFLYLLYKNYGAKKAAILFALIIVTFALSNTISVEAFKKVFERLRPCHNEQIGHLVHLFKETCAGKFGFLSSHAANVFGLATLMAIFLKGKIKYIAWYVMSWASFVSYSRIYLGKHYPLDILCGAVLGMVIALIVYTIAKKVSKKPLL
jgi:undecaprenyl-diphosphatase